METMGRPIRYHAKKKKGKFHIVKRLVDVAYLLTFCFLVYNLANVFAATSDTLVINEALEESAKMYVLASVIWLIVWIVDVVLQHRKR